MDEDDIRPIWRKRFQASTDALLASGPTGDRRQGAEIAQSVGDRFGFADGLNELGMACEGFRRVANDRTTGEGQELLRDVGTEAASGSSGDKDSGNSHSE